MNLETPIEWLAWGAIVIPLATLAWQAFRYNQIRREENQFQKYQRLFKIAAQLEQGGSIVSQVIAAYELRKFPEYRDVIIRICEDLKVEGKGDAVKVLRAELKRTAAIMKKVK